MLGEVYGAWDAPEACMSSTWRELEAVNRVLKSNAESLIGVSLKVYTDNKNVETILRVGSKKTYLHDKCMDIHETCVENDISISSQWIPRESNKEADRLSRMNDCDDWGIQTWVFMLLDKEWGSHTFDRFATNYNRKCDSFNSKFWCSGTSGIDAFRFSWSSDNNWLVPPPCLVIETVNKLIRENATGTLVVPEWKSAPFWPIIHTGFKFRAFIKNVKVFKGYNITHRGRGRNGIFGTPHQNFNFLALRFEP